ncbi:hypothetical protein SELMODRAFT_71915, partial [Selaginella moellendorffii]
PNEITLVLALDACSNLSCLENGRAIHDKATELGVEKNIFVENALVDMYGKCGSLEDALTVFNSMKKRDIVSWTAMVAAYARNGHSSRALEIFRMMTLQGVDMNDITFVNAIFACSHSGMLVSGLDFFSRLHPDFGIVPRPSHYICMVELLARIGQVDMAVDLIESMPYEPDAVAW